jgi:GC-rich sequence DNA-binding factor
VLAASGGAAGGGDNDEDDEDAEEERWVREQLRAAAGVRGPTAAPARRTAASATAAAAGGAGAAGAAPRASAAAAAAGADAALASLREGLRRAEASWSAAGAELARTEAALGHSAAQVRHLEAGLAAAGVRYKNVQEVRDYVRDLCECLKDKAALIEELEEHMARLHEAAAAALEERAAADAADEAPPAEASVAAADGALQRGAPHAVAAGAAAAAAAMARAAGGEALPAALDEFGRDLNYGRRSAAPRRAAARAARRAAAAARRNTATTATADDTASASSSESEGERASYEAGAADAADAAGRVFADADVDFASLPPVKARLEAWKAAQPGAYRDAYVALSAPALFAPFVRLELLTSWSPLRPPAGARSPDAGAGFDHMAWFAALFDYGMPADAAAAPPDDPDASLVPTLVAKVALPRVAHAVERAWAPQRRRQSARIAAVLSELCAFLPPDEPSLAALLDATLRKLAAAASATRVPAWRGAAVAAAGEHAGAHAARAAAAATRMLAALGCFEGTLPRQRLHALALDGIVAGQLAPHLRALLAHPPSWAAAARRTERAARAIPDAWLHCASPFGLCARGNTAAARACVLTRCVLAFFSSRDSAAAARCGGAGGRGRRAGARAVRRRRRGRRRRCGCGGGRRTRAPRSCTAPPGRHASCRGARSRLPAAALSRVDAPHACCAACVRVHFTPAAALHRGRHCVHAAAFVHPPSLSLRPAQSPCALCPAARACARICAVTPPPRQLCFTATTC